jgi:hypothetical protein
VSVGKQSRRKRERRHGGKTQEPASNSRSTLSPAQERILRTLGPLDGAEIPGGCDHCDAYQTVKPSGAGVWAITVHHDDWCPVVGGRR